MIERRSWFQRPFASCCLLGAVTILSVYIILNSNGERKSRGEISYRITIRHYGTDSGEMETSAAIPIEDALSALPGINRIVTMSENSRMRAFVSFSPRRRGLSANEDGYYDAVREAAQRVYETLPPSAQRPELSSSGDFHVPFWTAAVYACSDGATGAGEAPDGVLLERTIKPALSSIEGVGEVEIAGPGIREIVIILDEEKCASMGLSPAKISGALAANDALFTGGALRYKSLEIPISIDGRYKDLNELGEALIPIDSGASVRLKTLGEIQEQDRESDTLSRLNGKKTAIVSVTAASGADPRILSNSIAKEMEKLSALPLEFRVLEDRGAEEVAAFRSVLIAALEASVLVAFAAVSLGWGKSSGFRNSLICAAAIPLILIISAAFLSAAGFPVNRKFLAGLAVGIGGAVDAVILSAEGFGKTRTSADARSMLKRIWPPLVSGAATSIAALLPLLAITAGEEITVIAGALGTVTLVSVGLALTLLPPLFLMEKRSAFPGTGPAVFAEINTYIKKIRRSVLRSFAGLIRFCTRRPFVFPVFSLFISAAAIFSLALAGADTAGEWAEDSVYVQIEFDGGFLKGEADVLLASWAEDLKKHYAVREVQTGARTGSGYGLITFDPGKIKINELREMVRFKKIPGAFIYIPEPSPADRIWTITVSGDDAEKCRELARAAASLCSAGSITKETVLNFKQGGPRLTLFPRRELLAQAGMFFSFSADTVRRGIHGPVAYKRNEDGRDTDVRLMFPGKLKGDEIRGIPLPAGSAAETVRVGEFMDTVQTREVSGIQRENRRRIASFSVRTNPGDPRVIKEKIMINLKQLELPPGYRIEFDPEAIAQAEALSHKFLNFLYAVLFCYMIIAAAEESLALPLVILFSVPPSLAIPVLFLVVSGIPVNAAAACALVAVSGMTVNASVISAGELWRMRQVLTRQAGISQVKETSFYKLLRGRLPALLATTGTTIAGGLPFLFLSEGNNALVRTLALVTVLGVGTSFLCSLVLTPSLMNLYFRFRKTCSAWRDVILNKEPGDGIGI